MKKIFIQRFVLIPLLLLQQAKAQNCTTNADLENVPGKYLAAAEYPWPAVRAEYFKNLPFAADKALAKKTLEKIELIEKQSHADFNLTGANWENIFVTRGYGYLASSKVGIYNFESSLHEFFCLNGKLKRNDEAATILRIYINSLSLNTLNRFLSQPFGSSMGDYDFGLQFSDWKNHKPADVNAQLITLFNYMTCNNITLIDAINSGDKYFQDVADKDIKLNSRSTYITRYWFIQKKNTPVLLSVSRKEYLESLLEYYEREKLYFPKLLTELKGSSSAKQYSTWEADVADKIAVVKKTMSENSADWLMKPAIINRGEDAAQTYKAGMKERTNYNRFWKFYDGINKSEPLYKYNPDYFKSSTTAFAKPQVITVAFRYVTMPVSLRILDNFTKTFDFNAIRNLLE